MNIAKKEPYKCETIVIYLAVILSSFVGAQFMGISLNKIALVPLVIYLFCCGYRRVKINKLQLALIIWYIFACISSIIGMRNNQEYTGVQEKLLLFILQSLVIYIPLTLMSGYLHNPIEKLKKAIIVMAKINAIWATVQFICWYGIKFDINGFIFNNILHGIMGTEWTVWNYEAGTLALRVTGFESDSAFFAILIVLGFCMVDSKIWQCYFAISCIMSISRTGFSVIFVIILLRLIRILQKRKIPKNILAISLVGTAAIIFGIVCAYLFLPSVQYQINYMAFRFISIIKSPDVGTIRHLLYIPLAFKVWLFEFGAIEKILGIGTRIGGVAFSASNIANDIIYINNNSAWAIECDIAELLLAQGILGFIIYYVLFKLMRLNNELKDCIIAILIAGIMYNVLETTLIQLFIILVASSYRTRKAYKYE